MPVPHHLNNALTIDVEDYFQVENFKSLVSFSDWPAYDLRVRKNVATLLDLLEECGAKATFFVLGWVGEAVPDVVRHIHQRGHEVASHGYAHQMITEQTPAEFREDVHRAKSILESITGERVIGYRAPTFSICRATLWALDVLCEEGFLYDSSIFPVRHDRYGIPDWTPRIRKVQLDGKASLIEVPPLTVHILGQNFPCGGGGYFRLAPVSVTQWAIRRFNNLGHPAVIYLHPWELDPLQPRFPLPPLKKFRHYVNLSSTQKKLRSLLTTFAFSDLRSVLARYCSTRGFPS